MMAVILAGGYARRLKHIARDIPKPLLNVANRPIIAYIFDKLTEIKAIQRTVISTNLEYEQQFKNWLERNPLAKVEIIADRSRSEKEKPGAICSLAEITSGVTDDCLIVAGDNLFTSSLKPMIQKFESTLSPVVALYDTKDLMLAKQYSTAMIDSEGRITRFVEKPSHPETTLIGTCIYIMPRRTLPKLREYLTESTDADRPGSFIEWLHAHEEIYGYVLDQYWWDIGTPEQYDMAQRMMSDLRSNDRNRDP